MPESQPARPTVKKGQTMRTKLCVLLLSLGLLLSGVWSTPVNVSLCQADESGGDE